MTSKPQKHIVDRTHEEKVDILTPPKFKPSGTVKTAAQAIADGDWLGSANFMVYTLKPEPSVFCQIRSPNALYAPGMLDFAATGYYEAGETGLDGLRELEEEIGISIKKDKIQHFGRRMYIYQDQKGQERKTVNETFVAEYEGTIDEMELEEEEVAAVVRIPIKRFVATLDGKAGPFKAAGKDARNKPIIYTVTKDSFPYNFDDYPQKMVKYIALKVGVDDSYLMT